MMRRLTAADIEASTSNAPIPFERVSVPITTKCLRLQVVNSFLKDMHKSKSNALEFGIAVKPQPLPTRNQVELLQIDTTTSESLPRFRALGISPRSLEDELEVSFVLVTAPVSPA